MAESKETITPLQRFFRLLKPDIREVRNVYFYAIFHGLIGLSLPLGIQAIVNMIQGGSVNSSWVILIVIVVMGIALSGVLQIYQLRITEDLKQKIFSRAAFEFAYRIPRVKLEELYQKYAPELMNRFFDIMSVQKGLAKILIDFSTAFVQVVFGLILLSIYHPFFIAFSVILLFLVVAIFRFTAKKGLDTSLKESKYKYEVASWLEEVARNFITFKLAGKTDFSLKELDTRNAKYIDARESHFKVLVTQYSYLIVFKVIVATGLLAIGGILVMEQMMNIGQFIAAEIIILLVINSVEKLILSLETIYDVLTSLEKVGQVSDLKLESDEGELISQICTKSGMKVELSNIVFRYPEGNKNVFDGLNLEVGANEKVLLKGGTGEGKTTILKIIAGLFEVQSGSLSFNDYPIGQISYSSLRAETGVYLLEDKPFNGTIIENVTLGREWISTDEVKAILKGLGMDEVIKKMPKGLHSTLGPENDYLSKESIKKILIARALVGSPRLVLLENILDDLAREEHDEIVEFIFGYVQGTLIIISSNELVSQKADKIYEVQQGRLKTIKG